MDAQFSTAYLVAAALIDGKIDFDAYTVEALGDSSKGSLAERILVTQDSESLPGALGPIELNVEGFVERVDTVKGSPESALSEREIDDKWSMCAEQYDRDAAARGQKTALPAWEALKSVVLEGASKDADHFIELLSGGESRG